MDIDTVHEATVDDTNTTEKDASSQQSKLMLTALTYGRELQKEFKDDPRREVKEALEETFALIAYPDARESSLAHLLEEDDRVPVAEELNSAILGMSRLLRSSLTFSALHTQLTAHSLARPIV